MERDFIHYKNSKSEAVTGKFWSNRESKDLSEEHPRNHGYMIGVFLCFCFEREEVALKQEQLQSLSSLHNWLKCAHPLHLWLLP